MFAFLIIAPVFAIITNYIIHLEREIAPFWWTLFARLMFHTYFPMWILYARKVLKDDPLPKPALIVSLGLIYFSFIIHAVQPLLGTEQFTSYMAALSHQPNASNLMNDICYNSLSAISTFSFAYLLYYVFYKYPKKYPDRLKVKWFKKRYDYIKTVVVINWLIMFISVGSLYLWGIPETEIITFQVLMNLYIFYLIYQGVVNRIFDLPIRNLNPENSVDEAKPRCIVSEIKNRKLYLDNSLTVESLAKTLNMPVYKLNQAIHEIEELTFNDIINKERIEEFKRNIHKPYTIETLALESGFRSKSTFNRAFKKHEGITPVEYKKRLNLSKK